MEELINTIIVKSMQLENQIHGSANDHNDGTRGENGIFSIGGTDGLTSGDIKNINPMRLEIKTKKSKCCSSD